MHRCIHTQSQEYWHRVRTHIRLRTNKYTHIHVLYVSASTTPNCGVMCKNRLQFPRTERVADTRVCCTLAGSRNVAFRSELRSAVRTALHVACGTVAAHQRYTRVNNPKTAVLLILYCFSNSCVQQWWRYNRKNVRNTVCVSRQTCRCTIFSWLV